jgi:predicted chitinase
LGNGHTEGLVAQDDVLLLWSGGPSEVTIQAHLAGRGASGHTTLQFARRSGMIDFIPRGTSLDEIHWRGLAHGCVSVSLERTRVERMLGGRVPAFDAERGLRVNVTDAHIVDLARRLESQAVQNAPWGDLYVEGLSMTLASYVYGRYGTVGSQHTPARLPRSETVLERRVDRAKALLRDRRRSIARGRAGVRLCDAIPLQRDVQGEDGHHPRGLSPRVTAASALSGGSPVPTRVALHAGAAAGRVAAGRGGSRSRPRRHRTGEQNAMSLVGSVGRNGSNRPEDALEIQALLNRCGTLLPSFAPLREDGLVGPVTVQAIELFQVDVVGETNADGRIDPDGRTYQALVAAAARLGAPPASSALPPEGGISEAILRAVMPSLPADKASAYLAPLNAAMREAGITTPLRMAAFLAQLAHESVELRFFQEIANGAAYEGRVDLGNTQPGDGPRFKGRGPIQLTGRLNYRSAGAALGLDLEQHPELVATPDIGFRVAGWFWTTRHLNAKADVGDFDGITRSINGGLNGKASRDRYYAAAKQVLGAV